MDSKKLQRTRDTLISIVCGGLIFWAVWHVGGQFVDAIVMLLLSMAVAFLLAPAVNFLALQGVPRVLGTLLVYIIVIAVLGGLGYGLVSSLVVQVRALSNTVINFFTYLPATVTHFEKFLNQQGGIPQTNINLAIDQIRNQAVGIVQSAATNLVGILFLMAGAVVNIVVVIVLSFYFTLDGKHIRDNIISIVPQRSLPTVLVFENALARVVGNYIRGQLTLAAIIGVLAGLVCLGTGLGGYALIVGVLGFIFETIPMVGPALASIPAILLSLLLPDPFPRTFIVIVCFIVIQMLESNVLGPRIVGHAVGLHPAASLLALLIFARLFGALGALLATPIVAASWVVIVSLYRSARGETADQIIARKRAPWALQRPGIPGVPPALRGRKRTTLLDHAGGEHVTYTSGGSGDEQVQLAPTERDGTRDPYGPFTPPSARPDGHEMPTVPGQGG